MTASKWRHFTLEELTCHCGCGRMEMDDTFMANLVHLRDVMRMPLKLSSAYRCPEYNAHVSHTGLTGPHTTGKAVDILIMGGNVNNLLNLVTGLDITGIGINQKGAAKNRFVHIDSLPNGPDRPRPWVWTY